jgi:hypothetical protein
MSTAAVFFDIEKAFEVIYRNFPNGTDQNAEVFPS